jgi:hypothetical protein
MRFAIVVLLVVAVADGSLAYDLGNQAPVKPIATSPENVPNPERQGGDTIEDATVIPSIPYSNSGTTAGYSNDYDEVCPYPGSTAPDVVYAYSPTITEAVTIDLCSSNYDTKLYVYDGDMNLFACNDDAYFGDPCGVYVSALENLTLEGGTTYYIVIDGYGAAYGPYVIDITTVVPCLLDCPAGGFAEGEPPLVDGYVDNWNGGCNTDPGHPFQAITGDADGNRILCGVGGWYLFQGSNYRDTDWYTLEMGVTGAIEIVADAEEPTYIFEIGPSDCVALDIAQQATAGACQETSMTITGYAPGQTVWFWAGSTVFAAPSGEDDEYDYVVWFSGLEPAVATESTTWGSVKALYE